MPVEPKKYLKIKRTDKMPVLKKIVTAEFIL